jgi:hypothetical protein
MIVLVAGTALADDIDAEIVKNLEFFDQMPMVEDLDMVEMDAQTQNTDNKNTASNQQKQGEDSND